MNRTLVLKNIPTHITTPRLILRPMQPGDGHAIHEAVLDGYEECVKQLCWPATPPTRDDVEYETRLDAAKFITREQLRFVILEKDSGNVVGRIAYPAPLCVWAVPMLGISYFLRSSAQGKGYATEATNALIRFAFAVLGARKIEIHCEQNNLKSIGVPTRLNIQKERIQRGTWPATKGNDLAIVHVFACFDINDLPPLAVEW